MLTVSQITNSPNNNSDTCSEGLSLDNKHAGIQASIFPLRSAHRGGPRGCWWSARRHQPVVSTAPGTAPPVAHLSLILYPIAKINVINWISSDL